MKKFNILVSIILISILSITIVHAVTGVKQTDIFYDSITQEPLTNIQEIVYSCSNSECNSQGNIIINENTGNSNTFTFEYPYNPHSTELNPDYYSHFSFVECYLPKEYKEWVWGYGANLEYDYQMEKAENCHSPIDSFSVTNTNYVNEPIIVDITALIEADAHSAFTDLNLPWFPSEYKDYYSAETKITLNIFDENNNIVYSEDKTENILMDTSTNIQFKWIPEEEGDYKIKVETDVTDCQCSSSFKQYSEKDIYVWPERPKDQCYTIINDLTATPQFAKEGELVTITYNKISNYADDKFEKIPVKTRVTYEITDENNEIVYSENHLLEENENLVSPKEFSFEWTPTESGNYNIKVTGIAESSFCSGKENPKDIAILGFYANPIIINKYDVKFIVKDYKTNQVLDSSSVNFNSKIKSTDSKGEAIFLDVVEGSHIYSVSKSGYETKTGSINVDSNELVEIKLNPIIPVINKYDVKFIVKDYDTNELLSSSSVNFNSKIKYTDSKGEAIFLDVIEGSHIYSVSKSGYETKTGSINVDSNEIVEIKLNPVIPEESTTNLTIIYPKGGETLSGIVNVLWYAENSLQHELLVDISYSRGDSNIWNLITKEYENIGSFPIDTEDYSNEYYKIKVCVKDSIENKTFCKITPSFKIYNKDEENNNYRNRRPLQIVYEVCEPLWECSSWSECEEGVKKRTCTDLNRCNEEEIEKIEIKGCELDTITLPSKVEKEFNFLILLPLFLIMGSIIIFIFIILKLYRR